MKKQSRKSTEGRTQGRGRLQDTLCVEKTRKEIKRGKKGNHVRRSVSKLYRRDGDAQDEGKGRRRNRGKGYERSRSVDKAVYPNTPVEFIYEIPTRPVKCPNQYEEYSKRWRRDSLKR